MGVKNVINGIQPTIDELMNTFAKHSDNRSYSVLKYTVRRTAEAALYGALRSLYGTPDAVIGGIPIWDTSLYETGMSESLLKYKGGMGHYFLHQLSLKDTFQIHFSLTGRFKEMMLTVIDALYTWGRAREPNFKYNITTNDYQNLSAAQIAGDTPRLWKGLPLKAPLSTTSETKYAADTDVPDNLKTNEEFHSTLTIATKDTILFDMYVETYTYNRTIEGGRSSIDVSLYFRKFVPKYIYQYDYNDYVKMEDRVVDYKTQTYEYKVQVMKPQNARVIDTPKLIPAGGGVSVGKMPIDSKYLKYTQEVVPTKDAKKEKFPEKKELIDLAIRTAYRATSGLLSLKYEKDKYYTTLGGSLTDVYNRLDSKEPIKEEYISLSSEGIAQ